MSTDNTTSVITDKLIPVDLDGLPIKFNNNDATMEAVLLETKQYITRKHLFADLLAHRAKTLPNGLMAVCDYSTAQFVTGAHNDPRGWDNPCPPTPRRIAEVTTLYTNGTRTAPGSGNPTLVTTPPANFSDQFRLSASAVDDEDGNLING